MMELKPCPFCGGTRLKVESKHNGTHWWTGTHSATVRCNKCHARGGTASCKVERGKDNADEETKQRAIEAWNRRAVTIANVETHIFDKEDIYPNCTVQVLTNTATGETSVGWWINGGEVE